MNNKIDQVFDSKNKVSKLMVHAIAGYPDVNKSREIICSLGNSGVDFIEIQIPFSDPLADGPTIMEASQKALDNGTTPQTCFDLIAECTKIISIPIVVMTYFNILYQMSIESFIRKCSESGVSGVIVPDLPYDVEEAKFFYQELEKHNIYPIQVISPGMSKKRLKEAINKSIGFVYLTLKVGITGAAKKNEEYGTNFLLKVKKLTRKPVLAGFGISSKGQVRRIKNYCEGVIIGSHLIDLYNQTDLNEVKSFIKSVKV